ncbi:unnamed protein product [Arctogadus glacialis]
MTTCGTVTKSLLLLAVVVALTGQGSAVEKFSECCTKVSRQQITETIVDYMVQKRNNHCVNAIIFQTEGGSFYCSKFDERWVMRKVRQLGAQKRAALASAPSLLITSTSTPPSTAPPSHNPSSSPPSPSSPTSLLKLITSSSSPPPWEGTTATPSTHYTVQ